MCAEGRKAGNLELLLSPQKRAANKAGLPVVQKKRAVYINCVQGEAGRPLLSPPNSPSPPSPTDDPGGLQQVVSLFSQLWYSAEARTAQEGDVTA